MAEATNPHADYRVVDPEGRVVFIIKQSLLHELVALDDRIPARGLPAPRTPLRALSAETKPNPYDADYHRFTNGGTPGQNRKRR